MSYQKKKTPNIMSHKSNKAVFMLSKHDDDCHAGGSIMLRHDTEQLG